MVLTAMTFSAQAQTTNICGRTPQVVAEILRVTPADDICDSVLESELATVDSGDFDLTYKGITSLQLGDFDGIEADSIRLGWNNLTELPTGIFSGLTKLAILSLNNNALTTLPPGVFSGLNLDLLSLNNNPNLFQFTVKFQPSALYENFTTASVRLTLREGAPRPVTVPLSATGATLSVNSLTLAGGDVRSTVVLVTRTSEGGFFELSQGELILGGRSELYKGFEIVRGPSLTTASATRLRIRAFLEGALE